MQTKIEINKLEQGLVLQTLVGDNQSVYAYYAENHANNLRYYIELKSANGELEGEMDVLIVNADKDITTFSHPYTNSKYLYINNMENKSCKKHVGNALHEYAFRMSVAHGSGGRVRFAAVRNTHIFHYKNGFLIEMNYNAMNYYLSMAEEMLKTGKSFRDLGSHELYLPCKRINEEMKKYQLSEDLLTPSKIIVEEADIITFAEKINLEIQHKSLAIQLILGLNKGLRPPQSSEDSLSRREKIRFFRNSGVNCQKTKELIETGLEGLIEQLPLDTEEKQLKFDLMLVGVIIFVMIFQDHHYGKQSVYNNEYLYPQITFDKVMNGFSENSTMSELFVRLGEDALLNKTLAFDGTLKANVFNGVQAIPEFSSLFNKYDLKDESKERPEF
ncbi:MAG: hypothetical protein H0T84_10745 [Tatlockia sp.]|nr:hypothetical protein [Tatlockia sp.]